MRGSTGAEADAPPTTVSPTAVRHITQAAKATALTAPATAMPAGEQAGHDAPPARYPKPRHPPRRCGRRGRAPGRCPDPAEASAQLRRSLPRCRQDRYPRTAALAAHLPALATTEQCDHGIE
ncbi:MAG: hypothetical protein U0531_01050 [Dehalococcoidia bacterium]